MGTKKKDGKDITSKKKRNHPKMKNKKQSEKSIISQLEDQYNSVSNQHVMVVDTSHHCFVDT